MSAAHAVMELKALGGTGNLSYANDTLNGTLEACGSDSLPVVVAVMQVLYTLVCAVGLPCNLLVIYVVLRYSNMQTVNNIYNVNLAIADVCFLLSIPFLVATMSRHAWPFGATMCKVYMISTGINQFTSSSFLCVMSADRYVAVCHPIAAQRLRTPTVSWIVAAATWSFSALVMEPVFMYTTLIPKDGGPSCNILWPKHDLSKGQTFTLYSFALGFITPLILIFVFYYHVIQRLRTVGPQHRSEARRCSHLKINKQVNNLIVAFTLCWMPYWAFQMAIIYFPPTECASRVSITAFLVAACLGYCNSAINPVLYGFHSDNFKKSFLKAFTCAAGNDVNAQLHLENSVLRRKRALARVRESRGPSPEDALPLESRAPAAPSPQEARRALALALPAAEISDASTSRSPSPGEALPLEPRAPTAPSPQEAPLIAPNGHTSL